MSTRDRDLPAPTVTQSPGGLRAVRHLPESARRRPRLLRHQRVARPPVAHARVEVVQLAFEGPDAYAAAGGLGVRVTGLGRALADAGVRTDLYFVGDPDLPGVEHRDGVVLHRWCQSISARARGGVYDAEEDKIADLCQWWPLHIADRIERRARTNATLTMTVVLAEDWHTAWPLIALDDELRRRGLRELATLVWTANNRFGFHRVDFARLDQAARIVTISRAMKHLMWSVGVNPLVVPNGIPDEAFEPVDPVTSGVWSEAFDGWTTMAKVGRWDPDKRWRMAIEAAADLGRRGERAVLFARGWNGSAAASVHYAELRAHAAHLGVPWTTCGAGAGTATGLAAAIRSALDPRGGVVEIVEPIAGEALRTFYGATDAVLANSGFEPFGLAGLEAMAAGALVVTGSTGEDYIDPFLNGFALDTDDPSEIVRLLGWARRDPARLASIRSEAIASAARYRWNTVIERLWLALDLPSPRR